MANLTLVIDDSLLQAARIKALKEGTSVNEICRQAIARFASSERDSSARADALKALMNGFKPPEAPMQPAWPGREALYEEALAERGLTDRNDVPARRRGATGR